MFKRLALIALTAACAPATSAQVCGGSFLLNTQDAVDAFNCQRVLGNLDIEYGGITNLDGLSELTQVDGYLEIYSIDATDLGGLANLERVGGSFSFSSLDVLDVDPLASLLYVGGYLNVAYNASLTNLDGLANLQSVSSEYGATAIFLEVNPSLVRCAVGLGPILTADQADPEAIDGPIYFVDNAPEGDCNSEADILAAYEALSNPSPLPITGASLAPVEGDILPAGRGAIRVLATATLDAESGQRFTIFLRLDGPGDFSRLAFRGEIKPRAGATVSQSIKLQTRASDPAGAYTLSLLAEAGSVAAPGDAAEVLATMPLTKAGAGLRVAEALSASPNPAADATTLRFAVAASTGATLVVYDALGREVARPLAGTVDGVTETRLDTSAMPAGLYIARLVVDGHAQAVRFSVAR